MSVTLNDLTVNFAHLDCEALLAEWQWLIGDRRLPILLSAIGDAFVQDLDNGAVYLLSTGEGTLERVAPNIAEFRALLDDQEFVLEHFVPHLVVELRSAGHVLEPGQLYGYKTPPHLGGKYSATNLEPTDIEVHFSLLGQLHRQTRGLESGARIVGVKVK